MLFAIKAVSGKETHLKQGQEGPDMRQTLICHLTFHLLKKVELIV